MNQGTRPELGPETGDGLTPEVKHKIKGILQVLFPNAKVYLYGSRARGTHDIRSDIDLALDAGQRVRLGEARAVLAGLYIPQKIDLIDLHAIADDFKEAITPDFVEFS